MEEPDSILMSRVREEIRRLIDDEEPIETVLSREDKNNKTEDEKYCDSIDLTSMQVQELGYEKLEIPDFDEIILYNLEYKEEEPALLIAGPYFSQSISLDLFNKFRLLRSETQGLLVLGMSACVLVLGYNSWPLIAWAWPKLISFADCIEVTLCAGWVQSFVTTKPYKKFMLAWKTGQPLTPQLIHDFGPDVVTLATSKTPDFLKAPKVMAKLQKLRADFIKK